MISTLRVAVAGPVREVTIVTVSRTVGRDCPRAMAGSAAATRVAHAMHLFTFMLALFGWN
jgi:hypothetical protein